MARLTRRRSHQRNAGANSRSISAIAARHPTRMASQSGTVTDVATWAASPETILSTGSKPDSHEWQRMPPAAYRGRMSRLNVTPRTSATLTGHL